ncbi:MAG: hypothetical protein K2H13_06155 [Eubacterium sp.]|nr:hypothetical protein [Eubacterium sp.]
MKNSKYFPMQMCGASLLLVLFDVFFERMGTFPNYSSGGRYSNIEILGIFLPLIILIIPIFAEKYRKTYWTKLNIVMLVITLIITTILIVVTYANKEYYWKLWVESGHWDRDNCPPIRWDVWNIIQPSIDRFRSVNHL